VGLAVEKGPDAFRTISEVAQDLDLPQHVLRFWETRFAQIKPLKRGGGRRYYRPDDIDLLRGIRQLLYGDGYTIRGVQQILREQGVRHVQTVGRSAEGESARTAPALAYSSGESEQRPARSSGIGLIDLLPSLRSTRPTPELPRVVEVPIPQRPAPAAESSGEDDMPPFPFRRVSGGHPAETGQRPQVRPIYDEIDTGPQVRSPLAARPGDLRHPADNTRLTPETVRLLKATLFELGECRRLLDSGLDDPD